jgi:hypothetical protein
VDRPIKNQSEIPRLASGSSANVPNAGRRGFRARAAGIVPERESATPQACGPRLTSGVNRISRNLGVPPALIMTDRIPRNLASAQTSAPTKAAPSGRLESPASAPVSGWLASFRYGYVGRERLGRTLAVAFGATPEPKRGRRSLHCHWRPQRFLRVHSLPPGIGMIIVVAPRQMVESHCSGIDLI